MPLDCISPSRDPSIEQASEDLAQMLVLYGIAPLTMFRLRTMDQVLIILAECAAQAEA